MRVVLNNIPTTTITEANSLENQQRKLPPTYGTHDSESSMVITQAKDALNATGYRGGNTANELGGGGNRIQNNNNNNNTGNGEQKVYDDENKKRMHNPNSASPAMKQIIRLL